MTSEVANYLEKRSGLRVAFLATRACLLWASSGSSTALRGSTVFVWKLGFLHLRDELERNHLRMELDTSKRLKRAASKFNIVVYIHG
jgi:hypothetical protein